MTKHPHTHHEHPEHSEHHSHHPSPKTELKQEEKLIQEGLEAIYGKDKQDFKKLDQRKSNRLTRALIKVIIALVITLVLGAIGYVVYQKVQKGSGDDYLTLEIVTPTPIKSGEEVELLVKYQNPNNAPIADLELDLNLPPGLRVDSLVPEPTNQEDLVWDLGTLGQHSDGTIAIKGLWINDVGATTPVQVFANFRPSNFNSEFQEIVRTEIQTEGSVLELSATTEAEASAGAAVPHSVIVKNTSESVVLEGVRVRAEIVDGFFLEESAPELEAGGPIEWIIESLEPGEQQEITYSGSFASDLEGFQYTTIVAELPHADRYYTQGEVELFTDVLTSTLSTLLVVNGSTTKTSVKLGGILRTSISMENTGSAPVSTADLLLNFTAEKKIPIDWSRASLDGGRVGAEGVYWPAASVGTIEPGANATFNLNLPLRTTLDGTYSDIFTVTAESNHGDLTIKSSPIEVLITTDIALASSARYYDGSGNALGRGPLPPTVGEATRYAISWRITNSLHDVNRVFVSAELPPYAQFIQTSSAGLGEIRYNSETRMVEWDISTIPKSIAAVDAQFIIEVIPPTGSAGSFLKLISGATLEAEDAATTTDLQVSTGAVDSNLTQDSFAQNQGIVAE